MSVTVAEIHAQVDFQTTLWDAEHLPKSPSSKMLTKLAKIHSVDTQPFYDTNPYKFLMPQSKFLSHAQVRYICQKYNLVIAPDFVFNQEVPERNKRIIEDFKMPLSLQHKVSLEPIIAPVGLNRHKEEAEKLWHRLFNDMHHANVSMKHSSGSRYREEEYLVEIMFGMRTPPNMSRFVFPIGKSMGLMFEFDFDAYDKAMSCAGDNNPVFGGCGLGSIAPVTYVRPSDYYRLSIVRKVQDDKGNKNMYIQSEPICPYNFSLTSEGRIQEGFVRNEMVYGVMIRMDLEQLNESLYSVASATSFKPHQLTKMVIAPSEYFSSTESFKLVDGYRLELVDSIKDAVNLSFVPDPIMLQPVDGGFLVITKWGKEASISEVQDESAN